MLKTKTWFFFKLVIKKQLKRANTHVFDIIYTFFYIFNIKLYYFKAYVFISKTVRMKELIQWKLMKISTRIGF